MSVDLSPFVASGPFLLRALGVTLCISLGSMLLGAALGVVVGVARTYGGRLLRAALGVYVDSMRAIPLLAVLVWLFFAGPLLTGVSFSAATVAIVGLGLHLGAYAAEAVRAGLTSVRRGQMAAALALGMSRSQAVRRIVLPQALIRMLPAFGSLAVLAVKDSAVASVIAVPELLRQTQVVAGATYRPFELYTGAMLAYFLLCYPLARGVDRLYRRLAPLGAS